MYSYLYLSGTFHIFDLKLGTFGVKERWGRFFRFTEHAPKTLSVQLGFPMGRLAMDVAVASVGTSAAIGVLRLKMCFAGIGLFGRILEVFKIWNAVRASGREEELVQGRRLRVWPRLSG